MKKKSKRHNKYIIKKSASGKNKILKRSKLINAINKNSEVKKINNSHWRLLKSTEFPTNHLSILGNSQKIGYIPYAVFPFVSLENFNTVKNKYYKCEGTGFFIHESGVFITAKHVPYLDDQPLATFIGIHSYGNYTSVRHVHIFMLHDLADICVGIFDKHDAKNKLIHSPNNKYPHLVPNFNLPIVGDIVKNFGFGNSTIEDKDKIVQTGKFQFQWHEGPITQIFLDGRDKRLLPGATIEGQYNTIGLASGGPVFNSKGEVIGVNSTSMSGDPPISYFTPINQILEMRIDHHIHGNILINDLFSS